jgi:stearoyl-CoA desaturase (delta-9 desaturase)
MTNRRFIQCITLISVIAPLVGTIGAIWLLWQRLVTGRDLAILGGMYFFTALGITIGFHRLLTHRSFAAPPAVRCFFLALGSMALQGPALDWASIHIKHHATTDTDDDPHSPVAGFLHAHIGWLFTAKEAEPALYGTWLLKDPLVMLFSRTFGVWTVLGFVIPYLLGGWTGVLWGGLVRIFLLNHVTWSVNSVCHTFGTRMFETPDRSKNNWLVGLLAFGEGWHNNHHAFPRSAFHGLRWWQFDLSAWVIRLLEWSGLATNVWRIPAERLAARSTITRSVRDRRSAVTSIEQD